MTSGIVTEIERWPLARLIPYARNARTHCEEQVAHISASIVEFGWLIAKPFAHKLVEAGS
jgi:hypothetical protein